MEGSMPIQSMLCGDEVRAAVIDMGSLNSRFGAAGQELPRHVFKSFVATNGEKCAMGDTSLRYVASEVDITAVFTKASLNVDRVEKLIDHGLQNCMKIDPQEYPLFFTDSNVNTTQKKLELLEICYEKFQSPATYIANSAVLSLFSTGRSTGVVVDMGASGTRITPVVEGYAIRKSSLTSNRGGDWIDRIVKDEVFAKAAIVHKPVLPWYDARGLSRGMNICQSFKDYHIYETIRDIKQWMCFVPYNPIPTEARHDYYTTRVNIPPYELPDGTLISHSDTLCSGPEKLFLSVSSGQAIKRQRLAPLVEQPSFCQPFDIHVDRDSIQDLIYAAVGKCDADIRKELLANIVLVGGCSVIDGVMQRLTYELTELVPTAYKPKLVSLLPLERHNAAWIGGSILSICGSFQQMWISKAEYEEDGVEIVKNRLSL